MVLVLFYSGQFLMGIFVFSKNFRCSTLNPTELGSHLHFLLSLLCLSYFRPQRSWTLMCLMTLIDKTRFNWKFSCQSLVAIWKWLDEFKHAIQVKHRQNRWSDFNYCKCNANVKIMRTWLWCVLLLFITVWLCRLSG